MTKICKVCGKEFAVTNKNQTKKVCSLACRTIARRMAKRTSDIKTAIESLGLEFHGKRIASHYAHAKEKHPHFCDKIAPVDLDEERRKGTLADYQESTSHSLATVRDNVACDAQNGRLTWEMLLLCETWEIGEAIANSDTSHAVEECYDAIAVLLRTIDVLEGRQKLGKPERGDGK